MPTVLQPTRRAHIRTLVLIWIGWSVLMLAWPLFARARLELARPDNAISWSAQETRIDPHARPNGLLDAVVGPHAAWDSEYYLSIALHGYDDPATRAADPASHGDSPVAGSKALHPDWVSVNHAFFPGYPLAIRAVASPLVAAGVDPLDAGVVGGVIVSLLGTLVAMLALYDLAQTDGDGEDSLRAGFYLLVWPASFFLAQVYSEGLFLALSLSAIALVRRRRWGLAAVLAAAATFTRATGAILLLPFVWEWVASGNLQPLIARPRLRGIVTLALAAAPAIAYLAWRLIFGRDFAIIETRYFGRGLLLFAQSWQSWIETWTAVTVGEPQARAYASMEFLGIGAGVVASLLLLRRDPALALYGLAILAVASTSGAALGMHRYVLSVPALFLVPARWGRSAAFDRLWTLSGTLMMAAFALAFAYGFWAG